MGELVAVGRALGGTAMPRFDGNAESRPLLKRRDVQRLLTPVSALQQHLGAMGVPSRHPYRAARLLTLLPTERQELELPCRSTWTAATSSSMLCRRSHRSWDRCQAGRDRGQGIGRCRTQGTFRSHLKEVKVDTDEWQRQRDTMRTLLNTGKELTALTPTSMAS